MSGMPSTIVPVHKKRHLYVLFCILLGVTACCSCAPTRSAVVLLPDAEGRVGTIEVASRQGTVSVDTAYQSVVVPMPREGEPAAQPLDPQAFRRQFAAALAVQPVRDFRFDVYRLYFHTDSVVMNEDSSRALDGLIDGLRHPAVLEIYVVGHADRLASNAYNRRLSCRRALVVKKRLVTDGIEPRLLKVACLGESEPQVETADEIGEPMNRRVKIVVKTALPH